MDALFIEKTKETPEIDFNPSTGILKISGRAYSNDIYQLFKPLNAWLDKYLAKPKENTTIELKIEYCNSIFNKLLIIFFENCKSVILKEKKLKIIWYYEKGDRESIDEADHISKLIGLPIEKMEY
jgi:hypothetical protein